MEFLKTLEEIATKTVNTFKGLKQNDWEVIGSAVVGTLLTVHFFTPVLGSIVVGTCIGLMIQDKLQFKK